MKLKETIKQIKTFEDYKIAKSQYFGKKGEIFKLQQRLKEVPFVEKKDIGQKINKLKSEAQQAFQVVAMKLKDDLAEKTMREEWLDVTIPSATFSALHPVSKVINLMEKWFKIHGYFHQPGDEIESDVFNFEKLNIGPYHPAREMQDSLYLNKTELLRTHNTGMTARVVEQMRDVPFVSAYGSYMVGKVYRRDSSDASHSHQFTQCDIVGIGDVSVSNLKWTLNSLISYIFEKKIQTRIRPSYFPFTEPSLEMDIYYNGEWIEILGGGMLHPNVFTAAGYQKPIRGFAAGIGIERLAMIKYKINDIRLLYKNDLRMLSQFKGWD